MDGLDTFQASSPLAFSLPTRPELYKRRSSQSIPLQAPMRGKRCARRSMQTLPCTSPNSAHIYRRNCREHFQWSHLYMCCSMWRPCTAHLRLIASFLLTPKVIQITRARHKTRGEPLGSDANVRRNCNMYVHAIYHLASALCACVYA